MYKGSRNEKSHVDIVILEMNTMGRKKNNYWYFCYFFNMFTKNDIFLDE